MGMWSGYTWTLVCIAMFVAFASGSGDPTAVFDLNLAPREEQAKTEVPLYKDPSAPRVLVVLLLWNGDVSATTDHLFYRLSSHTYVAGTMKVAMSSTHRAKNYALQYLVKVSAVLPTHLLHY
jgi:hypothetical protein